MSLPRGMEMMIASLVKMLGLDPALMMRSIEDIGKSLHSAAADMATIRRQNNVVMAQNSAIMSHLGISEQPGEHDDRSGYLNGHSAVKGTECPADTPTGD